MAWGSARAAGLGGLLPSREVNERVRAAGRASELRQCVITGSNVPDLLGVNKLLSHPGAVQYEHLTVTKPYWKGY